MQKCEMFCTQAYDGLDVVTRFLSKMLILNTITSHRLAAELPITVVASFC